MKLLKCKCGTDLDWRARYWKGKQTLICSECGEPYPDLHKENEELRNKAGIQNDYLMKLRDDIYNSETQNSELEKEVEFDSGEIKNYIKQLSDEEKLNIELQKKIEGLEDEKKHVHKFVIEGLESQNSELEKENLELHNDVMRKGVEIVKLIKENSGLQKKIDKVVVEIDKPKILKQISHNKSGMYLNEYLKKILGS